MNTLVIICSKSPNPNLYRCIEHLYTIQIQKDPENNYKIIVIDSDSNDFTNYDNVKNSFPEVELLFIQNKNYEYGAWKYAYSIYPNFDNYFCIQDTIFVKTKIDLNQINNENAYTVHHRSGYHHHMSIKSMGIENLKNTGLDYKDIIDTEFNLALHSSFIVNNNVMQDIFKTLINPPVDKIGSCFYERNFGLYFIIKQINTIDLNFYTIKSHGNRY